MVRQKMTYLVTLRSGEKVTVEAINMSFAKAEAHRLYGASVERVRAI